MSVQYSIVLVLTVVAGTFAFTAEYIPKSFYVIHSNGERSPVVYLREKRSLQEPLFPLVRMRRSGGGGGSGSGSGSFSSSSSYSGAGAGANDAIHFADNLAAGFDTAAKLAGFPNGFPGGIPGAGGAAGFHGGAGGAAGYPGGAGGGSGYPGDAGGCSSCGGGGYGGDGGGAHGGAVPNFQSRFGGDDGVSYTGSAQGAKGVYSASSSSIDSDGNVKYSVKTGKY